MSDVLAQWDLKPDQLVATTTDNAPNIIADFRSLGWMLVSCFGHNLDLDISKSLTLDQVNCALARCHSPVELFHCNWWKNCDLCLKQDLLNLPQDKLIASAATRWGLTYDMVSRIVEQQQAIIAVQAEDRKKWYHMPYNFESSVLETVVTVLKPLSALMNALSGEKQVTISSILPVPKNIEKALAVTEGESRLAMEMKKVISNDLKVRNTSSEIQRLFGMACFLEPRFKDRHIEDKENIMSAITINV